MLQPWHMMKITHSFYSNIKKVLSGIHKDHKTFLLGNFSAGVPAKYNVQKRLEKQGFGSAIAKALLEL